MPADRTIDGRDIWPLLSGQTHESPHEALFYFNGNRLEAVRAAGGNWPSRRKDRLAKPRQGP